MIKRKPQNWRRSKKIARKTYISRKGIRKPKTSKIALWRGWLVPDGAYHRYQGIRGVYWYWLSRDVRESEWNRWEGKCLTCLVPLDDWREGDCGHLIASSTCGEFLRFYRNNLTLQHKKCNNPRFTPMAAALNAIHYDQRYGAGAWDALYGLRGMKCKEPKKSEYPSLILDLPSYQKTLLSSYENDSECP